MEKITQKEFKNILATKGNILYKRINTSEKEKENIKNTFASLEHEIDNNIIYRTCEKVQSRALMFSNKSWLYFDNQADAKEYYKHNNFIMVIETYNNKYNNDNIIIALIYNIKED